MMTKWISVKDKLPDELDDVLLYCGWHITGKYNGNKFLAEDGRTPVFEVTHWMPLPDAPKESNDD